MELVSFGREGHWKPEMFYRDILVHLERDERSNVRLDVAIELARMFSATLSGVYGESDPHVMNYATRDPEAALGPVASQIEASFRQRTEQAGIAANWLALMTVNDTELVRRMMFAALHADLVLLGQYRDGDSVASVPPDLVTQIVLNCGRPVLCVPAAGRFETIGKRVMLAWNISREATRAVHDALPFLGRAEHVRLVAVNPDFSRKAYGEEPFASMQRHLAAHGIAVQSETLWVEDIDLIDGLLSRIADESIDMLVMGAHGHYGFPYLHRGGITREILHSMTVPVLMSH